MFETKQWTSGLLRHGTHTATHHIHSMLWCVVVFVLCGGAGRDPTRPAKQSKQQHTTTTYIGGVCCCCFAWRVGSRPQANKQQQSKSTPYSIQGVVLLTLVEGLGGAARARAPRSQATEQQQSKSTPYSVQGVVLLVVVEGLGARRAPRPPNNSKASQPV